MVRVAAICDPEGGLFEEARTLESPPAQPAQPEWNLPTWEDIVRTHSARVYRLAYRLTGNPHDAEDLTQEVFVRVFRSLSSYTPGTFEGWLHRITTNLFLDWARRKQRIRFEGLADEMAHRLPGSEPTPAEAFDDTHLDDDVQAALKALPPEYRAAVVLCDIEGFSYEEIAATLGVKLGTVRSRIHRGRAQLRTALEHRRPATVEAANSRGDQQRGDQQRGDQQRGSQQRGSQQRAGRRSQERPGPGAPPPGPGAPAEAVRWIMSHLGDRLSALVDGELDGAERDRAYAHLASCEQCRTEAAELRALKRKLSTLLSRAPAEAAMTRRLIAMTGPGGPLPPRRRLLRLAPGPRPAGRRETRRPGPRGPVRRRYLVFSAMSLVVGLSTAAFTAGGGGRRRPGPGSRRRWRCTASSTPSPPGRYRSPARQPGRRWPTRTPRNLEVGVFAFNCPVTRRRDARPPVLLTAVLAVAVPGFLVTACSGQTAVSASPQEVTAPRRPAPGRPGARTPRRKKQGARPAPWPHTC